MGWETAKNTVGHLVGLLGRQPRTPWAISLGFGTRPSAYLVRVGVEQVVEDGANVDAGGKVGGDTDGVVEVVHAVPPTHRHENDLAGVLNHFDHAEPAELLPLGRVNGQKPVGTVGGDRQVLAPHLGGEQHPPLPPFQQRVPGRSLGVAVTVCRV